MEGFAAPSGLSINEINWMERGGKRAAELNGKDCGLWAGGSSAASEFHSRAASFSSISSLLPILLNKRQPANERDEQPQYKSEWKELLMKAEGKDKLMEQQTKLERPFNQMKVYFCLSWRKRIEFGCGMGPRGAACSGQRNGPCGAELMNEMN